MKIQILNDIKRRGVLPALGGTGLIEQDPEELADFVLFIKSLNVVKYLEVGTSQGALLDFMIGYVGLNGWGINLFAPKFRQDRVFIGDCASPNAIKFAESHGPYDILLVDADHKYESIVRDTNNYFRMATKVVAFHDICGLRDCQGSKKHWEEMMVRYPSNHKTFINPSNPVGIGAIIL